MKWEVQEEENLARFLSEELSQSGKGVRRLLQARLCRVNGRIERFGSASLQRGDRVEISSNWKGAFDARKWEEKILYEDEEIKIVDKIDGWVCDEINAQKLYRAFLVHRLDKETTGALLLAKRESVQKELMELFAQREVKKRYFALVDGEPREEEGIRESYLARKRSYQGQVIWGSSHRGVRALTRWKVLARGQKASLLLCEPFDGRTHQIRVHLAEMGHPILADRQYASTFRCPLFASRILLHASQLEFSYQGKAISTIAPLPSDFQNSLEAVGMCAFSL